MVYNTADLCCNRLHSRSLDYFLERSCDQIVFNVHSVHQIRRGSRDIIGIIILIFPLKHIL